MESNCNKKDTTIQKIQTERGFADEIFKKYRYERYGVGTCCGSNLPSYIKDKYLCDFQDSKVTQYDSIKTVVTKYDPPATGAKDDANRPGWVDAACGMAQGDIEVYFYYDATSLGLTQVQAAYNAAKDWIEVVKAEANQPGDPDSCNGGISASVKDYHTTVFGERWLDWATSSMTGMFQNSGSCGGNATIDVNGVPCASNSAVTGTPVNVDANPNRNFGTNDCNSAADSVFPWSVNNTNKFWAILKWAQSNGVIMHNGGPAGVDVTASVLPVAQGGNGGTDTSGGVFAGVTSIGMPPIASKQNLLVVTFLDEATSTTHHQPYHGKGDPATWNNATDGSGTVTPCWAADHTQFIQTRNIWMAGMADRKSDFYMYPSAPSNPGPAHHPLPLHVLGAITSGDKTPADGTLTTAPFNTLGPLTPIQTSNPYFAQGYGALDQHGWGTNVFEGVFQAETFQNDLDAFVDLENCNDSECFLFVVKDQNGNPISCHPITINGGVVGETNENGFLRWCVNNASVNTRHILDLCTCLTTTGGCKSQKVSMTITDKCKFTACDVTPFQACEEPAETTSSGNLLKGCTDPNADNYNPNATVDDGSCKFCESFTITTGSIGDATENNATPPVCQNDGFINIIVAGGTPPYTFQWTGPSGYTATTQNITGICGGVYNVFVTDSATNPCTEAASFFIDQPQSRIYGCMDATACNYNSSATHSDNSCLFSGCTDSSATNYDPTATADCNCNPPSSPLYQNDVGWDSCCTACVDGCMDPNANNFNSAATCDDGSCTYNYSCIQTGSPGFNSCDGYTNIGTFSNSSQALNFYTDPANGFTHLPINSIVHSLTGVAPQPGQCVDANGNIIKFNGGIFFTMSDIAGTSCPHDDWPLSWTAAGLLPDANSTTQRTFITESWDDVLNYLQDTLAQGQQYVDWSNSFITSFNSLTYQDIATILQASQGTLYTGPGQPALQNLLYPECQYRRILPSSAAGPCTCLGTTQTCTCTEMTDGTGIYPTIQDCQNSPTECCNTSIGPKFVCVPGNITNSCSNKTLASPNVISLTPNLNDNLAQEWTSSNIYWPVVPVDGFYFKIDNNAGGSCFALINEAQAYITKLSVDFDDPQPVIQPQSYTIQTGGDSWAIVQNALFNAGYNGTTYPDLSNADWNTAKIITAQSQPGAWSFRAFMSLCNCTNDGNCDCIEDQTGQYNDYASCIQDCCDSQLTYGCTDPNAINYDPNVQIDDSTCLYCDDLNAQGVPTPIHDATFTDYVDPTPSNASNGSVLVNFAVSVNTGTNLNVLVYDSQANLVQTNLIPGGATSYLITGLPTDNYTIVLEWIKTVGGSTIIMCSENYSIFIGNPGGALLWECVPNYGNPTIDVMSPPLAGYNIAAQPNSTLYNAQGAYTQVGATPYLTVAARDWTKNPDSYGLPLSLRQPWGYQIDGPFGSADCVDNLSGGIQFAIVKFDISDSSFNTLFEMTTTNNNTWNDLTSFVSGLVNNPGLVNANYEDIEIALAAAGNGDTITVSAQKPINCGDCECIETHSGIYTTEAACNSACCISGCTDPAADNYNPNANLENGSCVYCSGFDALLSNADPTIPTGNSGSWNAGNINVNNGQILASGIGGSGQYAVNVYYEGYNGNAEVNPISLYPGFYKVVLFDIVTQCTRIKFTQLEPLSDKCRTTGTPWYPTAASSFSASGQWNELTSKMGAGNLSVNPNAHPNTNVWPRSLSSIYVTNLNHTGGATYTVRLYNNATGANVVTLPNVSGLVQINALVQGTSYTLEVSNGTGACDLIGHVFTFDAL